MMFGLVSLLVIVAISCLIFYQIEVPTIQVGEKAQDQARQISGHGENGVPAMDSFKTEAKLRGSELVGLTVTAVTPGGAMADYGLQKGDVILSVNGAKVGDISVNDAETAKAMVVQTGFQGNNPIVVLRDGAEVTLPTKPGSTVVRMPGASTPAAQPASPTDAVKDQLNNLGLQTH
jgi:S1-C subfamily serine protease